MKALINVRTITAATVAILIVNAAILHRAMDVVKDANGWVTHTLQVREALNEVVNSIHEVKVGQRGFTITGDDTFLQPYTLGTAAVRDQLARLQAVTLDNSSQQERIERLRKHVENYLTWEAATVRIRREEGGAAAAARIMTGDGMRLTEALRTIVAEMRNEELRLLDIRTAEAEVARRQSDFSFWLAAIVDILLVMVAGYFIARSIVAREKETSRLVRETWLNRGDADLASALRGVNSPEAFANLALDFFHGYLGAQASSLYGFRAGRLHLLASLGRDLGQKLPRELAVGEGLVGAALRHGRITVIEDVPESYMDVSSSLGHAKPRSLVVVPLEFEGSVNGVLELASLAPFPADTMTLLESARHLLGGGLNTVESRRRLQDLLEETQRQAEELQTQQEELRVSNEELEQQAQALELQKETLAARNDDLRTTQANLERKADELERASKYKSEFLANMSHELRTPLNSLLILATLLSENKEKTLSDKQIEFARTIYRAGNDLLALINDILDLSKVEAGKLSLSIETVDLAALAGAIDRNFRALATEKGLELVVERDASLPVSIISDGQRLEQILKNLVANAVKFTSHGSVRVRLAADALRPGGVLVSVKDTGIGIPRGKLAQIFEAFEQVDRSTSRAFGGTGLGLTISRELARLLGAAISVESEPSKGSTFTLRIPPVAPETDHPAPAAFASAIAPYRTGGLTSPHVPEPAGLGSGTASLAAHGAADSGVPEMLEGDVAALDADERVVLIVEDDRAFAMSLIEVAHEQGFKAVVAATGEAGLATARRRNGISAVILDVKLPDLSGLGILERLKRDPATRHLPVHVVSAMDHAHNALQLGAVGYLLKPASKDAVSEVFAKLESVMTRAVRKVLIVEDDKMQRDAIKLLLGNGDVEVSMANTAAEAMARLAEDTFDCMVLDLHLPDMTGFELLEKLGQVIPKKALPPVVVYTGKDLSQEEQALLQRYAHSIIVKGVRSPERLLDEVSLFLHRVEARFPADSQAILQKLRADDLGLAGRRVLLVDDDMRNVFALANALDAHRMRCVVARNGREALDQLERNKDIELVLMDIMMPVMNGYEAMTEIRKDTRWRDLPVIALTAKAMKGDHERCLAAGANDYLPKPVDLERLTSLLRVWLPRRHVE